MKKSVSVCAMLAARLSLVFGVAAFAARPAEAGSLPAEYVEVGCLVSHGTEYINTEYTPTKDCRIVLNFAYATDAEAGGTVLGFGASANAQSIRLYRKKDASTGIVSYCANFDDNYGDICYVNCGEGLDTDRHTFDVSNASKTLDGAELDQRSRNPDKTDNKDALTKTLQGPLYLFAFDQGWNPVGAAADPATCKIYSCQIYDGTTLVRDFVPCLNANGEPVLYDLAGQKAYANKGSGKFECEVSSPFVEATLTGCRVAADGQAHGPVLTVTEPASGYQVEWSTDGVTYTSERSTFTDPGEYPVFCRISADGYTARSLRATVLIGYVRRIVATAAEAQDDWADATVAGEDAWAAIQGVIDGCGVGDLILVKAGSYLLTNELAFASAELRGVTLRSDDGEGNLARKATLLVGGYPATSNRLVRIATPEVIVEGFTLTNGFVNAASGGGALIKDCDANSGLRSCDIVGCTAWYASYMTAGIGNPDKGAGGGAYVVNGGVVSNCLFRGNTAFAGGAVYLSSSRTAVSAPDVVPRVTDCQLVENQIIGYGNVNNCNGSALGAHKAGYLDNCYIASNACNSTCGPQIRVIGNNAGYLVISNCVFMANRFGKVTGAKLMGTNTGNGIRCVGCTFIGESGSPILGNVDSASGVGHSMINCSGYLYGSEHPLRNCFFYGNTGDYCLTGRIRAESCTFVSNKGVIWSNGSAAIASRTNVLVNCILYNNQNDVFAINAGNATPIALFVSNTCIRASSLVQTGNHQFGLVVTNGCNIVYNGGQREYAARELIRFYANGRGDCHLRAGSALLGAGMTLGWMDGAVDADGNPRVAGGAPDIGCYERQAGTIDPPLPCTRAVATEADKKDEWADATVGLQAAVDVAYEDEPLYMKAGTYNVAEPITLKNQGVLLIGEGPGATIIDGGYPARTNRLFTITQAGTRIRGMTLQNSAVAADGGAILVSHDDFTLDSCVVSNCCAGFEGSSETARYGGGVYVDSVYGNVLLTNTLFVSCAARLGGGVAVWKKDTSLSAWATRATVPVVSDCEFVADRVYAVGKDSSGRTGHGQGAGAFGSLWVEHSRFCGNFTKSTDDYATALAQDSYSVATNCIFEGHLSGECATIAGRGDCLGSQRSLITQCTFRGNSIPYLLMGMATVENCQVVSNSFTLKTALDSRGNSTFKNVLFAYNTGVFGVGKLTYENCTFVTNEFGICLFVNSSAPTLRNCVSCGNTGTVSRISDKHRGTADFCYERGWSSSRPGTYANDVVLGCWKLPIYKNNREDEFFFAFADLDKTGATSNIVAAVEKKGFRFVDPAKGNWRLKQNSPLRDKALTLDWMTDEATDLDGKPRRISSDGKSYPDSLPDIGCYECDIPKPGLLLQVW